VSRLQLPGRRCTPSAATSAGFGGTVSRPKGIRAIAGELAQRDRCSGEKGAARHQYGSDENLPPGGGRRGGKDLRPLAGGAPVGTSGRMGRGAAVRTLGRLAEGDGGKSPRPDGDKVLQ
jgi:hypothetical protein